jgi:L-cysteine S-thiosulfotransferase
MINPIRVSTLCSALFSLCLAPAIVLAQTPPANEPDPIAEYRAMFGDDNPAELWQARGAELWRKPAGAKQASLSGACDLGAGPGVVKGAYAHLPRYFPDTHQVQDLESRLLTCMSTIQGQDPALVVARRFGDGDRKSDLEALSAFIVAASRGIAMQVSTRQPQEQQAYELGKRVFYYRSGPHDFSCSTCHGQGGKRIRLQKLPNLTDPADARSAYTSWPGYRVSQGELRTMEWRIADCFRQQRLPQLQFGSEVAIALTMFMAHNANGGVITAPTIKR